MNHYLTVFKTYATVTCSKEAPIAKIMLAALSRKMEVRSVSLSVPSNCDDGMVSQVLSESLERVSVLFALVIQTIAMSLVSTPFVCHYHRRGPGTSGAGNQHTAGGDLQECNHIKGDITDPASSNFVP